mmetsp:Transcript_50744/g.127890  ORF Transcript_50744/g.127890 Transcript_50744/m.127890 type:complete len:202 (+) Transcript_50744:622-1227(+)
MEGARFPLEAAGAPRRHTDFASGVRIQGWHLQALSARGRGDAVQSFHRGPGSGSEVGDASLPAGIGSLRVTESFGEQGQVEVANIPRACRRPLHQVFARGGCGPLLGDASALSHGLESQQQGPQGHFGWRRCHAEEAAASSEGRLRGSSRLEPPVGRSPNLGTSIAELDRIGWSRRPGCLVRLLAPTAAPQPRTHGARRWR